MNPPFQDLAGAYAWLDGHINYERNLGAIHYDHRTFEIDAFRRRLGALGDPQRGLRTIHIAGTRGKGSAALAIEALLRASGLRTAVYQSPHIREYRERIRIDGQPVDGAVFTQLLSRIARVPIAREGGRPVHHFKTVFENLTALFFMAARDANVDWVVIETGLGGRLDATNVIDPGPVLLTRIGLEHTQLLGKTLEKIAGEKAAILKPDGWGVVGTQDASGEAMRVFGERSAATGAPLSRADELCPIEQIDCRREGLRLGLIFEGQPLAIQTELFGDFQAENLQNALAMLCALRTRGLVPQTDRTDLARALGRLRIPGRLERVCRRPELFADGGHCPTAAAALARAMEAHFGQEPAGLLVAMMDDKDHNAFFEGLARWGGWKRVVCYRGFSPRAAPAELVAEAAKRHFHDVEVTNNLGATLQEWLAGAEKNTQRAVATGSLYSIAWFQDWGAQHGQAHSNERKAPAQTQQEPGS